MRKHMDIDYPDTVYRISIRSKIGKKPK